MVVGGKKSGNMSSIDFDEVLVHVGEKGKYQNIMYYLLCISATLPAAFLAFSQVSLLRARSCDRTSRVYTHTHARMHTHTYIYRPFFPSLRFLGIV